MDHFQLVRLLIGATIRLREQGWYGPYRVIFPIHMLEIMDEQYYSMYVPIMDMTLRQRIMAIEGVRSLRFDADLEIHQFEVSQMY